MPIIIGKPPSGDGGSGGTPSPEQEARLTSVESVNTQQNLQIDAIQTKDTQQDTELLSLNSKVDGVATTSTSQAERITELENNFVDYAPTIQTIQAKDVDQDGLITLANGKNDEQDLKIGALESTSTTYNTRMNTIESTLPNKADLVSGKIPMAQLPDLPVGRKVSVADTAARLALPVHPDLTIAYQVDTADAWVLDSDEDPSVVGNWDKLGNAQATGVQSFNGRTGNVTPTTGDYTSAQITISSDRAFISDADRVRWDNKSTPTSVEASVSGLRTEVAAAYVKTTNLAANNGVATLGSDGKVPTAQLPPLGLTTAQSQRIDQIESNTSLANAKGDSAATNILAVDNRLTQVDTDSKSRDTAQTTRLTAIETRDTAQDGRLTALEARPTGNYIPVAQKAAANGVASLGTDTKVPLAQLPATVGGSAIHANTMVLLDANGKLGNALVYRDVASGLAPLDTNRRVPVVNLPAFYPQSKRVWRDVKASRTVGTWVTNTGSGELEVHVRQSLGTTTNRFVSLQVRENSSATVFVFNSTVLNPIGSSGVGYADSGTITVPGGWQYQVATVGGLTDALIERWYELY